MKDRILENLPASYPWKSQFHWFDTVGSTNDLLKAMARQGVPHGTVALSGHQTAGRGRMGRSFHSPAGMGIYLSLLLRPNTLPEELMHLTCATAIAVCDAVQTAVGIRPGIKWTNDLVHDRRKLGGILTELGFGTNGRVEYAIIGVGLNCCQQSSDFPEDLQDMAVSLEMAAGHSVDCAQIAASMMNALYRMSLDLKDGKADALRRYRQDCITIGQEVSILRGDEVHHDTALDVDENGALVVRFPDGCVQTVNSGEVSIRGMYGYL